MLTPILLTFWVITIITVVLTIPTLKESHKTHFGIWSLFYITLFIEFLGTIAILLYLTAITFIIIKIVKTNKIYSNFIPVAVLSGDPQYDQNIIEAQYKSWTDAATLKNLPKDIGEYIIANDNDLATNLIAYNTYSDPHLLTVIAGKMLTEYDYYICKVLAENPSTSPKALSILAQNNNLPEDILNKIVDNPHTTEATLKYIIGNSDKVYNLINGTSSVILPVEKAIERLKLTNPDLEKVDNRWIIASYSQDF